MKTLFISPDRCGRWEVLSKEGGNCTSLDRNLPTREDAERKLQQRVREALTSAVVDILVLARVHAPEKAEQQKLLDEATEFLGVRIVLDE